MIAKVDHRQALQQQFVVNRIRESVFIRMKKRNYLKMKKCRSTLFNENTTYKSYNVCVGNEQNYFKDDTSVYDWNTVFTQFSFQK